MVDPKDPSNRVKMLAPEALRGCGGILVRAWVDACVGGWVYMVRPVVWCGVVWCRIDDR